MTQAIGGGGSAGSALSQLTNDFAMLNRRILEAERDLRMPIVGNLGDRASSFELAGATSALVATLKQEREAIAEAIARFQLGKYGRCDRCGRRIDLRRLAVLPSARRCIRCAAGPHRTLGSDSGDGPRRAGRA